MATFKFVIGHKGKTYQVEKDQKDCRLESKKIGDTIGGELLGMSGYEMQITGGSDSDGFPLRKDIEGVTRKRIVVSKGTGMKKNIGGFRKRKMLRGNVIASDIAQINCKVIKEGEKSIEELLGKKGD